MTEVVKCKHPGCERPKSRLGYCGPHYRRQLHGRDMDAPIRTVGDDRKRFWAKVDKSGDCWEWTAGKVGTGYGAFVMDGKHRLAHRVAYEFEREPIPDGIQIDHMCHNTTCVNPEHLRPATTALNGQNRAGSYSNSASGVRGVVWYKPTRKWRAEAMVAGERTHVGYFDSLEEAESAITEWRREHMPYSLMDQKKKEAA